MNSEKPILVISPIGRLDVDRGFVEHLGREIGAVFGYPADIRPLLDESDLWPDPVRKQYHSTPILDTLAMLCPPEAIKVVALTKVDLFIPILTHVYGEAQLGGKACILSTCRFSEGQAWGTAIFHDRIFKEAIHELGHTFNLRHCADALCVMHYCRGVREVDRKSNQFCRYCAVLLQDEMKKISKQ
ncbi:MAG: archaemetzincin [Desulfobacterota bacterium]|jgi:archaemetzincin|nr:archaemetzincin [Thermodesulfobacteriota bacterium]